MGKASTDKEKSSVSESEPNKQKTHGWIRLHLKERTKPPSIDEPLAEKPQSLGRSLCKPRGNAKNSKGETG
jgi:hypothetical protein